MLKNIVLSLALLFSYSYTCESEAVVKKTAHMVNQLASVACASEDYQDNYSEDDFWSDEDSIEERYANHVFAAGSPKAAKNGKNAISKDYLAGHQPKKNQKEIETKA